MSFFTRVMKRVIKLLDGVVNLIALLLILSSLLLSGYSLWDVSQIYHAAEATVYEAYIPSQEDTRSFEELRAINPEVIGWLRVNETFINYPLVQAQDNSKYVNTDVEGKYSLSGAIFLDCTNTLDFTDFNSIIYGHHMEKNRMFGDIGLFAQKDYFDAHPYGNLFFNGRDHGLEFFAFMTVDAYDPIFLVCPKENMQSWQDYLDRIYESATWTREMDVTLQDHLVLLSTCTSSITNGRNILVGRLSDTVYPEAEEPLNFGSGVDALEHWFGTLPTLFWIALAVGILLILSILAIAFSRRKKRRG